MSKEHSVEENPEQKTRAAEEAKSAEAQEQHEKMAEAANEQPEDTEAQSEEPSAEKTKEESELEKVKEELGQVKDQHLRLFADFENYKKRTARERIELFGSANQELMSALLPVLDDFKRALKNMDEAEAEGVKLIYQKFENTLKQKGLKPMENTIGKVFDVDTMEAVTRIPAPDKKQKGKVIDEIEQGFYLGNKIIRYAKVVVGE